MPVIAVIGTTATGKTAVGVELAKALESEVISADSQLVYQELDIGTAKPTPEEKQGIPHHMIDLVVPTVDYSVAQYQREAGEILKKLLGQGKVPIVVGGTGFYIRSLLQGEVYPEVTPDAAFRQEMANLAASSDSPTLLHEKLSTLDPRRAVELHPNDHFRIIRALEIIHHTGQPVPKNKLSPKFEVIWVGLHYEDRALLDEKIDGRIEAMVEAGWLEEVKGLVERYGADARALQVAHGYPEWVAYLKGTMAYPQALEQIQTNIHQYARRQLTWFGQQLKSQVGPVQWFDRGLYDVTNVSNWALKQLHSQ